MSTAGRTSVEVGVERLDVSAYTVPSDMPEADGTLKWDSTTLVLVEARGGDRTGLGYTYGDHAIARLVESKLASAVEGRDALDVQGAWAAMSEAVRNDNRRGLAAYAIAAVDVALWDLKARLLDLPLARLLGRFHAGVPAYGSGGFTSYPIPQLQGQLSGWAELGFPRVKMKVGSRPEQDPERVAKARDAIGDEVELFVDANGAYSRKRALELAEVFAEERVSWFEEPVSSDDLEGLRLLRDRAPAGMQIAAGEYGTHAFDFRRMVEAGAVDVLQADVTRCGGVTGFLAVDGICKAWGIPFSAHCAPSISAHACCAMETLVHTEYFHDHVRVEHLVFDGVLEPREGVLFPADDRSGLGIEVKRSEAQRYET
jgi:L-alanine-DL-glutamate epimerase-like enolase superfamily enzyme